MNDHRRSLVAVGDPDTRGVWGKPSPPAFASVATLLALSPGASASPTRYSTKLSSPSTCYLCPRTTVTLVPGLKSRHYHREPGSDKVESVLAEAGSTHYVSWLTLLETQSAFALKVRTGEITESDLKPLRARLRADISARRLLVIRVLRRHYDRAKTACQIRTNTATAIARCFALGNGIGPARSWHGSDFGQCGCDNGQ